MAAGMATRGVARRIALGCTVGAATFAAMAPVAAAKTGIYEVGAAKIDVTPASLTDFYLGGYGIGPVHKATAVLRHIYFRVIAIRDRSGSQVVIGAIDSQGYSIAYQQGLYGFRDVENEVAQKLGIPAGHIILQATHSHNAPDEIGVWGGVPDAYFATVAGDMESAIATAVANEQPAVLKVGTADMTGYSGTFGSNSDETKTGDNVDYPLDQQMRVLQALTPKTHDVIATLVNFSSHATVYGPLNKISPDWPGATATYLEGDELDTQPGASYGYPGSTAVVTIGAVGHSWPAGVPAGGTDPSVDPGKSDDNYGADIFGNAVARKAIAAVSGGRGTWVQGSVADGTDSTVRVANTNAVLAVANNEPANPTPLGGYKIDRANTRPWDYGDDYASKVTTLRVGNLPFYGVPGEPYPSIKFDLDADVHAPTQFIFGLAQDQLGYVEEPSDYNGALQCSTTDEWFFTISPAFGGDVTRLEKRNARALGFTVGGSRLDSYGPGGVPSLNCTEQQFESQGLPGSPPVG